MAKSVLIDAGFIVALLSKRDLHHQWAATQASRFPPPWNTCEAVLSEAFHLLATNGLPQLRELLHRSAVILPFNLGSDMEPVLKLMQKYKNVPMSLADACLVRMTEILASPTLLTTDSDFAVYKRHTRKAIPAILPS